MSLHITLAQVKPVIANPEKNINKIKESIEKVYDSSDLIIFPELFLIGYYSKDLIYRLAEYVNSDRIKRIIRLAREYNINIVTGFAERDSKYEILYNSALLAKPDGSIHVYRKMHLPDFSVFDEARYFRRWDGDIELWNINGFDVGTMICYDIFFPEISRAYTYRGAKILIGISATPDFSMPLFHKLIEARAIENTVYFIWVNSVGTFDGLGFAGGSRVIAPLGSVLYEGPMMKEDLKTVELDLHEIRVAREKRPVLKDMSLADVELIKKGFLAKNRNNEYISSP